MGRGKAAGRSDPESTASSRQLRVVVYPAEQREREPWKHLLNRAIEDAGATIEGYTRRRLLQRRYDVVALHHVEYLAYLTPRRRAVARAASFLALVVLARARGAAVVWTVHNLGAHDARSPRLAAALLRSVARLTDGWVAFSEAGRAEIATEWPTLARRPHAVLPHGHFRDEYPDETDRRAARESLDIGSETRLIVFVGQIRPYKGVPDLIAAFSQLDDPQAVLLVAGLPVDPALEAQVRAAADDDARVRLELGFVPGDRLSVLLRAADLAVLPFRRILNSGSALLALSFDCPILVPATGPMGELARSVGSEWVLQFDGTLSADHLRDALKAAKAVQGREAPLENHEWSVIGAETAAFYRHVVMLRR